jgi:RNase P/RNase MRP subunit p29
VVRATYRPGEIVRATATLSIGPIEGKVVSDLHDTLVVETEWGTIAVGNRCSWERLIR